MKRFLSFCFIIILCGLSLAQTATPVSPQLIAIYQEWDSKDDHIQNRLEDVKHHVPTVTHGFTDMTPAQFAAAKAQANKDKAVLATKMRAKISALGTFKALTGNYSLKDLKKAIGR